MIWYTLLEVSHISGSKQTILVNEMYIKQFYITGLALLSKIQDLYNLKPINQLKVDLYSCIAQGTYAEAETQTKFLEKIWPVHQIGNCHVCRRE